MTNILTIARLTVLTNWRSGAVAGIAGIVVISVFFFFFFATGDNELINELQLRVQYSYALSYALLTFMMISISCFLIRSQIDNKHMHLMTSYPIKRGHIWIGEWLGLAFIAAIAETTLILCIIIACVLYARSYPTDQIQAAKGFFALAKYENRPIAAPYKRLTENRIKQLIRDNKLDPAMVNDDVWRYHYDIIRREEQLIPVNGTKVWRFDLKERPHVGEQLQLKFRFYAEKRRRRIQGSWLFSAPGKVEEYVVDFDVLPYVYNTVPVPVQHIPDDGKFELKLIGRNDSEIIISPHSGLMVYHEDVPLALNVVKAFTIQVMHMAVTIAMGLTTGAAFTFPVAAFLAIVLYGLSMSSSFLSGIAQDIMTGYQIDIGDRLAAAAIDVGIWLAKGLQAPAIIEDLSTGISISLSALATSWLPGLAIYAIVMTILGIVILTKKELDKIIA